MNNNLTSTHENLRRGATVSTADGKTLGEVDEIRPDFFQVITVQGESYWLPQRLIAGTADEGHIALAFPFEELAEHRRDDPGASHVVPATSNHHAYIAGASREDANELYDPNVEGQRR